MKTKIKMIMLGFFLSCGISSAQSEYTFDEFYRDVVRLDERIDKGLKDVDNWDIDLSDPILREAKYNLYFQLSLMRLSLDTQDPFSGTFFQTMSDMSNVLGIYLVSKRNSLDNVEPYFTLFVDMYQQLAGIVATSSSLNVREIRGQIAQFSWLGDIY